MYHRTTTPSLLSFVSRGYTVLVFVQHGVSTNFTRASPAELNYFKAGPVHGIFAISNSEGQTAGGTRERQQRRALATAPEGAGRAGVTKKGSSDLQQRRTDGRRHTVVAISNSEGQAHARDNRNGRLRLPGTPEGAGRAGVTKKADKL